MAKQLVESIVIPRRKGRAFKVRKGHIMRLINSDGAQVADLDIFNLRNPKERFCSSSTRAMQGAHLTTGAVLVSNQPWGRPLMTIVADTVGLKPSRRGAVSHDLLYGRCNRHVYKIRFKIKGYHPSCQDNLTRAVKSFGLEATDVHDPFNVFMRTGLGKDGKLFNEAPLSKQGDYVEFRAERDCLIAISACPGMCNGPDGPKRLVAEIYKQPTKRATRSK